VKQEGVYELHIEQQRSKHKYLRCNSDLFSSDMHIQALADRIEVVK